MSTSYTVDKGHDISDFLPSAYLFFELLDGCFDNLELIFQYSGHILPSLGPLVVFNFDAILVWLDTDLQLVRDVV